MLQVDFDKTKSALFRRAAALSCLEGTEVAVLIFGPDGKLSQFTNTSIEQVLKRYSNECQLAHETVRPLPVRLTHAHGIQILNVSTSLSTLHLTPSTLTYYNRFRKKPSLLPQPPMPLKAMELLQTPTLLPSSAVQP